MMKLLRNAAITAVGLVCGLLLLSLIHISPLGSGSEAGATEGR